MKIFVKAKTRVREEGIEKIGEASFVVKVKEPPMEGKANEAIVKTLAGYFGIPASRVHIVSGYKSKSKIVEITGSLPIFPNL